MIVRELLTRFGIQVDQNKIKKFDQSIKNLKTNLEKIGQSARHVGKRLTTFITLPLLGLGAGFIKMASDAEESESKFNTIFSNIQDKANQTAQIFAKNFNQSSLASKKLLGNTANLLTGFGFTQEAALELSKQVNELAVDLESFTNFSGGAEGASQALTKALLGERESIKNLGISILEEDVQKQVAINRSKGLRFETERQAKAFATLQLAQKQAKNAIGDLSRTSQSFANRLRLFKARISDLSVAFGQILLPAATKVVNTLIPLLEKFNQLSPATKKLILIIGGIAAVLGPVIFAFGLLANGIAALGTVLSLLVSPIGLVVAALGGLFFIIFDFVKFLKGKSSLMEKLLIKFFGIEKAEEIKQTILSILNFIKPYFQLYVKIISTEIKAIIAIFKGLYQAIKTYIRIILFEIKTIVAGVKWLYRGINNFGKLILLEIKSILVGFRWLYHAIQSVFSSEALQPILQTVISFFEMLKKVFVAYIKIYIQAFGFLWDAIKKGFEFVANIFSKIKGFITKTIGYLRGGEKIEANFETQANAPDFSPDKFVLPDIDDFFDQPNLNGIGAKTQNNVNNDLTYNQKIQVNVSTDADPEEIAKTVSKETKKGFDNLLRHTLRMNQVGAI